MAKGDRNVKSTRNKEQTRKKILDATGRIILRDGFKAVGINAVAREAGVDKVLIYRYFDDLIGLLRAFAIEKDYWLGIFNNDEGLEISKFDATELRSFTIGLITGLLKDLIKNREMQELLLWELTDRNEISEKTNSLREEKGIAIMKTISENIQSENVDMPSLATVLVSGIYFLVLHSKTVEIFNSIPLNTDEGWQRIEKALEFLCNAIFDELIKNSKRFKKNDSKN